MQLSKLIESKILEGQTILQQLDSMRKRNGTAVNVAYYVSEDVEQFRKRINKWQITSKEILIRAFGESHRHVLAFSETITRKNIGFNYKQEFKHEVNQGLGILESVSETLMLDLDNISNLETVDIVEQQSLSEDIFIVHGHNEEMKQSVARVLRDLGLNPIILHEQPNGGKTIIEKFESNTTQITFAVILLSADDLAASLEEINSIKGDEVYQHLEKRARQNVVFEMGYFAGKLKRANVFFLLQDGVAKPGDLDGIVYTPYDSARAWRFELVKELRNAGYKVSADQVL